MASKKPNKRTMQVGELSLEPEARSRYLTATITQKDGTKVKTRVHYKELWGAVYMLGNGEYRAQMIPDKKEERMVFSRKHEIIAKRDIKAGEKIAVWCEVDVAKTVVEAIAEKEGAKVVEQVNSYPLTT
jgi:hypothetical protein